MNEKDRKDIEQFLQQDSTTKVEYTSYHANKTKNWITNDNSGLDSVCAQMIRFPSGNVIFYVKRQGCSFFDPQHPSNVYRRQHWKQGPVSKIAFDLYLEFLGFGNPNSKGHSYFKLKAERLV